MTTANAVLDPGDRVLALDVSTHVGVAVFEVGHVKPLHVEQINIPKGCTGERLTIWRGHLFHLIRDWEPEAIVFEQPFIGKGSQQTIRLLMSMCGLVEEVAFGHPAGPIDCYEENNSRVRARFSGKGSGKSATLKARCVAEARHRGWIDDFNDNKADACALGWFTVTTLGKQVLW